MFTANQILKLTESWSDKFISKNKNMIIFENYFKSVNTHGNYVNIYINPTYDDVKEIFSNQKKTTEFFGDVRTIIDAKTHKIYVWDSYLAIHDDILQLLGYGIKSKYLPNILTGYANIINNKLVIENPKLMFSFITYPSDVREFDIKRLNEVRNFLTKFFNYDWSFADKYLGGFKDALAWLKTKVKES